MDKALYFKKTGFGFICAAASAVIAFFCSVIGAVNGAPVLLVLCAAAMGAYTLFLSDKRPAAFILPALLTILLMLYRIVTIYIKNAMTKGFGELAGVPCLAMLLLMISALYAALCITGAVNKGFAADMSLIAAYVYYVCLLRALGLGSTVVFVFSVPVAAELLMCAYGEKGLRGSRDIVIAAAFVYVVLAAMGIYRGGKDGAALSAVLALVGAVQLGIFCAACFKDGFDNMLKYVFAAGTALQLIIILFSARADWAHISYYFMYTAYIFIAAAQAIVLFCAQPKAVFAGAENMYTDGEADV